MKNIRIFLSENSQFSEMKFPIYLNRRVFGMSFIFLAKNMEMCFFFFFNKEIHAHV